MRVAGQVAAIEQGNREFHVIRIEPLAFGQRSRRGAQLQAQVPDFLREITDGSL